MLLLLKVTSIQRRGNELRASDEKRWPTESLRHAVEDVAAHLSAVFGGTDILVFVVAHERYGAALFLGIHDANRHHPRAPNSRHVVRQLRRRRGGGSLSGSPRAKAVM